MVGRSVVQKKFADLLNMSIMWMMEMMKTQWLKRIECIFHIPVELIGNGEKLLDPFHSSHLLLHWIIRNIRSFVISCELSQAHLTYTQTGAHACVFVCLWVEHEKVMEMHENVRLNNHIKLLICVNSCWNDCPPNEQMCKHVTISSEWIKI